MHVSSVSLRYSQPVMCVLLSGNNCQTKYGMGLSSELSHLCLCPSPPGTMMEVRQQDVFWGCFSRTSPTSKQEAQQKWSHTNSHDVRPALPEVKDCAKRGSCHQALVSGAHSCDKENNSNTRIEQTEGNNKHMSRNQ